MGELDRLIRRRALVEGVSPEQLRPPDWRHDPYFLHVLADAWLQEHRLLDEAERLDLLPDLDQLMAAWREHPELSVYLDEDLDAVEAELQAAIGLGVDDIYDQLRAEIAHRRWADRVVERIGDDDLWAAYQRARRTVVLDVVGIPNVPTADELAAFLEHQSSRIEDEYERNARRYIEPERVDVRAVRAAVSEEATAADVAADRERARALRARVAAGEESMEVLSTGASDDAVAQSGGLYRGAVRAQVPLAFDLPEGELGPLERDAQGFVFYRVERRWAARRRPLDATLRREIASNALVRERILSRAGTAAARIRDVLETGDEPAIDRVVSELSATRRSIGPDALPDDDLVPGLGRSAEAARAVRGLDRAGQVTEPLLVETTVYVVRLIERNEPTRAELEAEREAFARSYAERVRATAWDAFWSQTLETTPFRFELPEEYFADDKAESP